MFRTVPRGVGSDVAPRAMRIRLVRLFKTVIGMAFKRSGTQARRADVSYLECLEKVSQIGRQRDFVGVFQRRLFWCGWHKAVFCGSGAENRSYWGVFALFLDF